MTLAALKSIKVFHTILKALYRRSWHNIMIASSQKKDRKNRKKYTYTPRNIRHKVTHTVTLSSKCEKK
jgi:hypothetical protein